ncbi:MAG: hydrogenase nickel incorporation protein HypB [Cyclobacteriaceae bacterium]|nr:hydrogenase nickel incorporation protein HypB [Cyclobacteriaceae bacterium]
MCATCGCDSESKISIHKVEPIANVNWNEVQFTKPVEIPIPVGGKEIKVEQNILWKNKALAQDNRTFFLANNIVALNLVSSPGSGKTSLLERTLQDLKSDLDFFVIEGDQQTSNDADRIAATQVPVIQINTGKGCHLDAQMIREAVRQLNPSENSVLFIENIGNLVCPAMFDLGEQKRVVIISVTEGDDKPLKYPDMFASSQLCIINKIDLLPYVNFNLEQVKSYARQVNRKMEFIELSCTTGVGLTEWYEWLKKINAEHTLVRV